MYQACFCNVYDVKLIVHFKNNGSHCVLEEHLTNAKSALISLTEIFTTALLCLLALQTISFCTVTCTVWLYIDRGASFPNHVKFTTFELQSSTNKSINVNVQFL